MQLAESVVFRVFLAYSCIFGALGTQPLWYAAPFGAFRVVSLLAANLVLAASVVAQVYALAALCTRFRARFLTASGGRA